MGGIASLRNMRSQVPIGVTSREVTRKETIETFSLDDLPLAVLRLPQLKLMFAFNRGECFESLLRFRSIWNDVQIKQVVALCLGVLLQAFGGFR